MSKTKNGILDGFSGKVGPVVGLDWNGLQVMRAYTQLVRNPRTVAQQINRQRFAALSKLSRSLYGAVSVGMRPCAKQSHSTAMGCFVKLNHRLVEVDENMHVSIDLERLKLSCGRLPGIVAGTPTVDADLGVEVPIADSCIAEPLASFNDHVVLTAYCSEAPASVLSSANARCAKTARLSLPRDWRGRQAQLYAFVLGAEAFNANEVSETVHVGTLQLPA